MKPFSLNDVSSDIVILALTILCSFIAFILLLVFSRKAAYVRQTVLATRLASPAKALVDLGKTAQARVRHLPSASHFNFAHREKKGHISVPSIQYGGPMIVPGSKYLWESRWSHLPSFEQGREGEERVMNSLVNSLGEGWHIFRNFVLPTQREDIDILLVGPGGIFAIEVKHYSGSAQFERGRCYVKTPQGRLHRQRRGPNGQVRHNAMLLNRFLKEHGITTRNYVRRLVVMSGDADLTVVSSGTDVSTLAGLRERLLARTASNSLAPTHVRQIVDVLRTAANEQMRVASSRVH